MRKKAKKNFFINMFSVVIGVLYLIIYILFVALVIKLDTIPNKYLMFLIGVSILISVLILLVLFIKKIKRRIKIIFNIITILLIGIYCFGIYYLSSTIDFVENINKNKNEYEEYYVVVNKKSNFNNLKDIKGELIYVLKSNDEKYVNAQTKLYKKINISYKEAKSIDEIFKKLNESNIILISSNTYSMLTEKDYNIGEFSKIIYVIKIKTKKNEITKGVNVCNTPFNIYISGIDTSGNISKVARSDVNMVATVNPITHEILLTSIPRDYYVKLHSNGAYDKLTHTGVYGINESIFTIEDLLKIDINYYVRVNFTTVIDLVDVIGGVTVNSDYSFTTHGMGKKYSFVKGNNDLNGQQALAFARERKSFKDGDRQRIKNQQIVLTAILNKIMKSNMILSKYTNILNTLEGSFDTNINPNDFKSIVKLQINDMPNWNIQKNSLSGNDSKAYTYTYGNQLLYVMKQNNESVQDAMEKINTILKNR